MAWLRIDDRVRTHPKIATAGPAAAWLWFCGICYCREHLTDGFIPKPVVTTLAMNLSSPLKHAARLVEVRLWEETPGGYQVHDFLDWNPSREQVRSNRMSEAERKRQERGVSARTDGDVRDVSARTNAGVREMSSCVRAGDAGLGYSSAVVPSSTAEKRSDPHGESFQAFWSAYPNHKSRSAAEKAWRKLQPDDATQQAIHAALAWQVKQTAWTKDGGEYVPHGSTWLNQRRWEDEPSKSTARGGYVPMPEPAYEDWTEECDRTCPTRCESRYKHGLMRERAS